MKVKIKSFITLTMSVLMLSTNVFATEKVNDIQMFDLNYIEQEVIQDNEIGVVIIETTETNLEGDERSARVYKYTDKTFTGYFYKTSDGTRVAEFDMTVGFNYDGSLVKTTDVSGAYDDIVIDIYNVEENWSCEAKNITTQDVSPTYAYGKARFELTYKGSFNNDMQVTIYCNQNGVTGYDYLT